MSIMAEIKIPQFNSYSKSYFHSIVNTLITVVVYQLRAFLQLRRPPRSLEHLYLILIVFD